VNVSAFVDSAVRDRVVIFGSLPPDGRDLDLLVRAPERAALAEALTAAGFLQRGNVWALFKGSSVESIELVSAADWKLRSGEVDALYEHARPIGGLQHVARPAPHHALLIAAGRFARDGGLSSKLRARIRAAVEEDRSAWTTGETRAAAWGAERTFEALRSAYEEPGTEPLGRGPRVERLRALVRRPTVVAFSGLDGSGKSTQARALQNTLERLDFEVAVFWTRLTYDPVLDVVANPVKAALRRRDSSGAQTEQRPHQRSEVLTQAWTTVVALANVSTQRRAARGLSGRGRVVIFDRSALDSVVQLRHKYGEQRRFAFQSGLIRKLSPRATAAFLLDVEPETALARKPDDFDLDELTAQARLYRTEAPRLGVVRLDGELPPEELSEEIARQVWRALD